MHFDLPSFLLALKMQYIRRAAADSHEQFIGGIGPRLLRLILTDWS